MIAFASDMVQTVPERDAEGPDPNGSEDVQLARYGREQSLDGVGRVARRTSRRGR